MLGFSQKVAHEAQQRTKAIFGEPEVSQIFKFCTEDDFNE